MAKRRIFGSKAHELMRGQHFPAARTPSERTARAHVCMRRRHIFHGMVRVAARVCYWEAVDEHGNGKGRNALVCVCGEILWEYVCVSGSGQTQMSFVERHCIVNRR